jgi:TonB family protein
MSIYDEHHAFPKKTKKPDVKKPDVRSIISLGRVPTVSNAFASWQINCGRYLALLASSLIICACTATPPPQLSVDDEYAARVKAPRSNPKFPLQRPPHPHPANSENQQGIVGMMIWVDEHGIPRKVILGKSSGDPELDEAAMGVLSYWRLQPGSIDGVPTAMWGCFSITYYDSEAKPYLPTDKDKADQAVLDQKCKESKPALPTRPVSP